MEEENDLIRMRLQKLAELRARGRDPFAVERFANRLTTLEAVAEYEMAEAAGTAESEPPTARVAGRITARRGMGKASFVDLQDQAGKLQLHFKSDVLGEEYELFRLLDLGDVVGVEGPLFRTRMGEVTLEVRSLEVMAKSLRPLPYGHEKEGQQFNTLEDVELRYRQRYVDLAVHRDVRDAFRRRSQIISGVRRFFDDRGYIEVETPVLQSVAGGAAARPFNTHHNALDHDFHLRISLELYLKRLIVGGIEKVYEIGRVFRNEGISTRHNPEFTLLESYEAYANLEDIEELVEQLVSGLATSLYGEPKIPYKGDWISVAPPWRRLPILEGIREYAGVQPEELMDFETAKAAGARVGLDMSHEINAGGIIEKLHERFTQPHLLAPTFITDFPAETSPLAKKDPLNPLLTRRFEGYIAHQELANAFSEINDPIDQRERFQAQVALRAAGDAEAHPMDEDFLRALEYGMPPTGGLGIGLDRLVMVLTEQDSIRDVILFPQMRPE